MNCILQFLPNPWNTEGMPRKGENLKKIEGQKSGPKNDAAGEHIFVSDLTEASKWNSKQRTSNI